MKKIFLEEIEEKSGPGIKNYGIVNGRGHGRNDYGNGYGHYPDNNHYYQNSFSNNFQNSIRNNYQPLRKEVRKKKQKNRRSNRRSKNGKNNRVKRKKSRVRKVLVKRKRPLTKDQRKALQKKIDFIPGTKRPQEPSDPDILPETEIQKLKDSITYNYPFLGKPLRSDIGI